MTAVTAKGTILMTGANGGLGSAIVAKIASSDIAADYHCIYTVRNSTRTSSLLQALRRAQVPSSLQPEIMPLDLEKLDNVRSLAADINERVSRREIPPIRVLVLNAAYEEFQQQTWAEGGIDTAWMVNYLSHWLLTLLLLRSMDRKHGRVVVIGSHLHDPFDQLNRGQGGYFDDPKWKTIFTDSTEPIIRGAWSSQKDDPSWCSGARRYAASKLCLVMMIGELQGRLDQDPSLGSIRVIGVDPGWMATGIARQHPQYFFVKTFMPWVTALLSWLNPGGMFRTPGRSAGDVVGAMFGKTPGTELGGSYFKGSMPAEVSAEAKDKKKRMMVWKDSVAYAGLGEGDTMLINWR
ncbi:NAD(P)-binding protein [Xylariomycetidae sp. FL2044]|nr:NAD(P)-binding protein [Xylariomycetidae sp. FL2044]